MDPRLGRGLADRLKANRWVNPDRGGLCAVALGDTAAEGTIVPRKGYGLLRFFKMAKVHI